MTQEITPYRRGQLARAGLEQLPATITDAGANATRRFIEFFTVPPGEDGISEFTLTHFQMLGDTVKGIHPRDTCQPGPGSGGGSPTFRLAFPSTLTICGENVPDCRPLP